MKSILILCILATLIIFGGVVHAEDKVVIVSLGRVQLEQLAADENMSVWLSRSSIGLLNTGTAGGSLGRHLYLTMGAGSRALGADSGRLAFMLNEDYNGSSAADIFLRHQGEAAKGLIVHLGIEDIIRLNQSLRHPVQPGLLGDTLQAAGKKTALIGNADGQQSNREAALLIADSQGQIDFGDISRMVLLHDELFPYARRMDKERVWQVFQDVYSQADLILLDWGDTLRLDEYRPLLTEQVAKQIESDIFQDVSWVMTRILTQLEENDLLVLLAAVPKSGVSGADTLGFMGIIGAHYRPGMLLTSATTRRPGLAAAVDIGPLVLEQLDLAIPAAMIGRSVGLAGEGRIDDLILMQQSIDRVFRMRQPLLKTYVIFQIIFVLGALLNVFMRFISVRRFEGLLMGLLTVPLLLLYLPLHRMSPAAGMALTAFSVIILTFVLQNLLKSPVQRFAVIAIATSFSLVVDVLLNAQLMKVSVLGYDAVSGARYYGLGNEYMGVLVGAASLAVTAVLTLWPRLRSVILVISAMFFLLILLLMVSPNGGANFGGALTALAAFLVTLIVLLRIKFGWKSGIILLTGLAAFALAAVLINFFVPQNDQSHLGRTLVLLQDQGWGAMWDILIRKGSMNIRLFRYSQWSRVLLVFLGVLAVLFYRPHGVLRDVHKKYPALAAGFLGIIAGSIIALAVNDSGVVAAATTLLYAGVPIIVLAAREVEEK